MAINLRRLEDFVKGRICDSPEKSARIQRQAYGGSVGMGVDALVLPEGGRLMKR